jgi:hypothetical protein
MLRRVDCVPSDISGDRVVDIREMRLRIVEAIAPQFCDWTRSCSPDVIRANAAHIRTVVDALVSIVWQSNAEE